MIITENGGDRMIEFEWSGARFVLADCGGGLLGEEIPMHCHSDGSYELHFITGGEGTLITRAGEYKMRTGNFFVTGPRVDHAQIPDPNDPVSDVFLYIHKKGGSKPDGYAAHFLETRFYFAQAFETVTARTILDEYRANRPGRAYAVAGLMINLLTRIARLYLPQEDPTLMRAQNLNDMRFVFIENMFLYNKNFTLKTLSDQLGICERQTQRLLKKYYGKTFREKRKESMRS